MNLKLKSALISVTAVIAIFLSVGAYADDSGNDDDVVLNSSLFVEDVSGITDEDVSETANADDVTKKFNEITVSDENNAKKHEDPPIIKHTVIMGDTNMDGKVTAADARLALRAAAGLETLDVFSTIAADIGNDRVVTAVEAREILRVAARLSTFDGLHQHSVEESPEVSETCTENGKTSTIYCSECSMIFKEHEIIPAGHKIVRTEVPPTCTQPGYTYVDKCERCGEIIARGDEIPAKGHTPAEDGAHCKDCGELYNPSKAVTAILDGDIEFTAEPYTRTADKNAKGVDAYVTEDSAITVALKGENMKAAVSSDTASFGITSLKTDYSYETYIYSDDLGLSSKYSETLIRAFKSHPGLEMILLNDEELDVKKAETAQTTFNGKNVTVYKFETTAGILCIYVDGDNLVAIEYASMANPDAYSGYIIDDFKLGTDDITYDPSPYKEVGNRAFLLAMSGYIDSEYIDIFSLLESMM